MAETDLDNLNCFGVSATSVELVCRMHASEAHLDLESNPAVSSCFSKSF